MPKCCTYVIAVHPQTLQQLPFFMTVDGISVLICLKNGKFATFVFEVNNSNFHIIKNF